jgi:endonuclease YncB( thermonuclease family)
MFCCFKKILKLNNETTSKYDLDNISAKCYVKSVYDSNTVTILLPIKQHIYNMNNQNEINLLSDNNKDNNIELKEITLKLYGIDTSEMILSKSLLNREEHIKKEKDAKQFLENLILDKVIKINFLKNDKYGRPLSTLFIEEININELMIQQGYANRYYGKTKGEFI